MNRRTWFAKLMAVAGAVLVAVKISPKIKALMPGELDGSTHETWLAPSKWVETPQDARFVGYYEFRHKPDGLVTHSFYEREWLTPNQIREMRDMKPFKVVGDDCFGSPVPL